MRVIVTTSLLMSFLLFSCCTTKFVSESHVTISSLSLLSSQTIRGFRHSCPCKCQTLFGAVRQCNRDIYTGCMVALLGNCTKQVLPVINQANWRIEIGKRNPTNKRLDVPRLFGCCFPNSYLEKVNRSE